MKTRTKYEDLALLPHVIADRICGMEYTGMEWSVNARHTRTVEEVEALRQKMTREQVDEFCKLADNRCKRAYDKQLDWFEKIVRAKGNRGRDQLYVWISHWLSSYLVDPEKMRRDDKHSEGKLDDATKELLAVAASKGIHVRMKDIEQPIKDPQGP